MIWNPRSVGHDGTDGDLHMALRSLYSGLLADRGIEDTRRRLGDLGVRTDPALNRKWSVAPSGQPELSDPVVRCMLEHAVIAMQLAQEKATVMEANEQLVAALAARRVIEQAKGILMGRHRCDANAAFMLLVAQSQRENRKLRQIAGGLVDGICDAQ